MRFPFGDPLREIYQGFGIDLEKLNGDSSWTLAMPARYVVDRSGEVVDAQVHADYTRRPEPEQTLEVLRSLTR